MNPVVSYVALGSNIGNRRSNLRFALEALKTLSATKLSRRSSFHESKPIGPGRQKNYLNAVVKLETSLSPMGLLIELKRLEALRGRKPGGPHWGPRTLDLDILTYGKVHIKTAFLTIPHPLLRKRSFVTLPGREIGLPS
jgi:2-amino-4-hydroxy-6-hydroxymethyldihydropteridine diphosphokinase